MTYETRALDMVARSLGLPVPPPPGVCRKCGLPMGDKFDGWCRDCFIAKWC